MTATNVEIQIESASAELARRTRFAGWLGIVKLLLLLGPFAIAGGCTTSTVTHNGLDIAQIAITVPFDHSFSRQLSGLMPFLLVPLCGAAATMILALTSRRPAEKMFGPARWLFGLAAVSLLGLVISMYFMAQYDYQFFHHKIEFLWGCWAIASVDIVTIVLLWVALANSGDGETRSSDAIAPSKSAEV